MTSEEQKAVFKYARQFSYSTLQEQAKEKNVAVENEKVAIEKRKRKKLKKLKEKRKKREEKLNEVFKELNSIDCFLETEKKKFKDLTWTNYLKWLKCVIQALKKNCKQNTKVANKMPTFNVGKITKQKNENGKSDREKIQNDLVSLIKKLFTFNLFEKFNGEQWYDFEQQDDTFFLLDARRDPKTGKQLRKECSFEEIKTILKIH